MTTARTPEKPLASELARKQDHGAGDVFAQRFADADGVRAHQVDLKLADVVGRDAHVAQLADAGGDGVGEAIVNHQVFDDGASAVDGQACLGLEHYGAALVDDRGEVVQRQVVAVDMQNFHRVSSRRKAWR